MASGSPISARPTLVRVSRNGSVSLLTKCDCLLGLRLLAIDMAEIALWRHLVPDQLLQFLHLGEAAMVLARPDLPAVDLDLEHASGVVGDQGNRAEFGGEGREKLLRRPAGPKQPVAEPAIGDLDIGAWRHLRACFAIFAARIGRLEQSLCRGRSRLNALTALHSNPTCDFRPPISALPFGQGNIHIR